MSEERYANFLKVSNNFIGWKKLINDMCEEIEEYIHIMQLEDFQITYLKEKYGGLRVEYSGGDEGVLDIIIKYENYSYEVCEACGKKGKVREDLFRIRTLCNKHYKEIGKKDLKRKI